VAPVPGRARRLAYAAIALAVFGLGLAGAAWQWRRVKKLGALESPAAGQAVAPPGDAAERRTAAVREMRGFMVWSSNRSGQHDLQMMRFPGLSITPLTTHPHVDTFPRISPDGERVVFCRSREPWVSQRNPVPWDVYVLDLASGRERKIAANANTPTWSARGDAVFYQRNAGEFVRHTLADDTATVLFEAGRDPMPGGVNLQTPSFSEKHQAMAVTLRRARRSVRIVPRDGEPIEVTRSGCQLAWTPGGRFLVYVDHGGRMKNAIYRFDLEQRKSAQWLDLPGAYSHEYFPRVANNGRHLVLGAAAEGHEHDVADYEIFLWDPRTPAAAAVRLTFHTGNDCWPDLWVD